MATQDVAITDITNGMFSFVVAANYSPADAGTNMEIATPTDVALTMQGLTDGQGRQSKTATLPDKRAPLWECWGAFELQATPTQGSSVDVYWAPSSSGTDATGNVMGTGGENVC